MPREAAIPEIGKTLNLIFELVGVLPERRPSIDAKKEIAEYIYTRLGYLAPTEIKLAFNVVFEFLPAEVNAGKQQNILEHYQSFSIPYLKKIIDYYMKWKFDALKEIERKVELHSARSKAGERYKRNDIALKSIILKSYYEISNGFEMSWPGSLKSHFIFCEALHLHIATPEDLEGFRELAYVEIEEIKNADPDAPLDLNKFFQLNPEDRARTIAFRFWLNGLHHRGVSFRKFSDYIENKLCFLDPSVTLDLKSIQRRQKNSR